MKMGPRKKRIRLSFIGGRRPSLLGKPVKKTTKENVQVEKKENSCTNDSNVNHAIPTESNALPLINTTYEIPLNTDVEQVLFDKTNKPSGEDRNLSKNQETVDDDQKGVNTCVSKEISVDFQIDEQQVSLTNSLQKSHGTDSKCVEQNSGLKERLEELRNTISYNDVKLSKISEELQRWEQLLAKDSMFPIVADMHLPKDIAEITSLDFKAEAEELQDLHDRLWTQQETLIDLECKYNLLKLHANEYLNRVQSDIQSDLNVNTTQNIETPRQLIKKIVHPK